MTLVKVNLSLLIDVER